MAITTTSQNNTQSTEVDGTEVANVNYTTDKIGGLALTLNITKADVFHATEEAEKDVNNIVAEAIAASKENLPAEA